MSTKFQQLFQQIMEDNSAGAGGVFGNTNAWSSENVDSVDTKATMSVVNWKNKKKKKTPLIRRNLKGSL
jgi:hypothetical protein